MTHYTRESLEKASLLLKKLMKEGIVSSRDPEYRMYQEVEVREAILDVFQPSYGIHVFHEEDSIYIVAADSQSLIYLSDGNRRERMKLGDQDELHLADFCMIVLASLFYNSSSGRPTRAVLGMDEWFLQVDRYIERWSKKVRNEEIAEIEQQQKEMNLNVKGIVEKWHHMKLKEGIEVHRAGRREKVSFLKKVAMELEREGLIHFYDRREIEPSKKWTAIMSKHYGMQERKDFITQRLN